MRVLVTGASGYLGRQVVQALLADARVAAVIATDLMPSAMVHPRLTFERRDLIKDSLTDLLARADAVIHLAFRVERRPGEDLTRFNVDAHQQFLQTAVLHPIPVIVTSSVAAYGLRTEPFDRLAEDAAQASGRGFYYAEQKIAAEQLLEALAPAAKARIIRVRPSAVGGPTIDPRRAMQYGGRLHLIARTRYVSRVQVLHEEDVGSAFCTLLHAPAGIYNLAPDDDLLEVEAAVLAGQIPVTVPRWLYGLACNVTWHLGLNNLDAAWAAMVDYPSVIVDNAKLKRLGWRPHRTTRDAILDTVAALRGRKHSK